MESLSSGAFSIKEVVGATEAADGALEPVGVASRASKIASSRRLLVGFVSSDVTVEPELIFWRWVLLSEAASLDNDAREDVLCATAWETVISA